MKIIIVDGNDISYGNERESDFSLIADSALLQGGNPFFIPDFAHDFRLFPSLAIKISRLGKNIAERFASRYYHEMAIAFNIRAVDMLASLKSAGRPWAEAISFDGSAIFGKFVAFDEDARFMVKISGKESYFFEMSRLRRGIDELISQISKTSTFKTGDIIILAPPAEGIPIARNNEITASFISVDAEAGRVKFNIK